MVVKIAPLHQTTYLPALRLEGSNRLYLAAKRLLDVLAAGVALILLAPLMAAIAVAIKLDSPGPVIFRQQRVRGNQPGDTEHPELNTFTFFKFRSMVSNADAGTHQKYAQALIAGEAARQGKGLYKLTNDRRITRVGRFLRCTSLDELPQLWNILCGDMTLVGPRPAMPYEVGVYKPWHKARLSVTPGLTGLWQVQGRNRVTFDEMVEMDLAYVQQRSLLKDVEIILRTIPAVVGGTGA